MHDFLRKLFPVCRSITGNGVRETLKQISEFLPLRISEVPSGTVAYDWVVPNEWNIIEAWIENEDGVRIVDFANNNLHVVGYSIPVDREIPLEELLARIHSLPEMPDAIPYVTSYYKETWGFCMTHRQRSAMRPGNYRVKINSTLAPGTLTYGELFIRGKSEKEIFISTYICHPSMANNELSGPVVSAWLARWLSGRENYYSYRFIFIPETIGAIVYLSRNLAQLRSNMLAGFVLSCVGDERAWSLVSSRYANTYADKLAKRVADKMQLNPIVYSYLERGSDERQFGAPGVDLPLVTFCRSKFGEYPEYHTSADDLSLVTAAGLNGSLEYLKNIVLEAEENRLYRVTTLGEPQLGKRGMYPTTSTRDSIHQIKDLRNIIAYADGLNDVHTISAITSVPYEQVKHTLQRLVDAGIAEEL